MLGMCIHMSRPHKLFHASATVLYSTGEGHGHGNVMSNSAATAETASAPSAPRDRDAP